MNVEIYGAAWCVHCIEAKRLCESNHVNVTYYDIHEDPTKKVELEERLGKEIASIPQIFLEGEHFPAGMIGLEEKF